MIDSAVRFCVPLFFALAGWVLLVKRPPTSIRETLTRLARVFIPFLVWSVLYSTWTHWGPTSVLRSVRSEGTLPPFPIEIVAREMFQAVALGNPVPGHLWFMGTYLPLIFILYPISLICQAGFHLHASRSASAVSRQGLLWAATAVLVLSALAPAAGMLASAGGPASTCAGACRCIPLPSPCSARRCSNAPCCHASCAPVRQRSTC